MSRTIKLLLLAVLVFSFNQVFAEVLLIVAYDAKGDTAACVELNKEFNKLALKLVPKNHPIVRLVQASYAGSESGLLRIVVEFDDLADMARVTAVLEANKEAEALQEKINKRCNNVSTSIGHQLYFHKGTN